MKELSYTVYRLNCAGCVRNTKYREKKQYFLKQIIKLFSESLQMMCALAFAMPCFTFWQQLKITRGAAQEKRAFVSLYTSEQLDSLLLRPWGSGGC